MNIRIVLSLLKPGFFILLLTGVAFMQESDSFIGPDRSIDCEYTSAMFDSFVQGIPQEKRVIIVSYQGQKELKKRNMAGRRLHNAKTYLTRFYEGTRFSRAEKMVVDAVSPSTRAQGTLEFYLDGNLAYTIVFRDNNDFVLSPCYIGPGDRELIKMRKLFYPALDTVKKKVQKK